MTNTLHINEKPVKPDYSVIIPAYNEQEYLPATLERLKAAMKEVSGFCGEIIVTDNNSTDRTSQIARESGSRVIFEEHRQIARARNIGGRQALGRYLIFVDSDTQISASLLKKTLMALDSGKVCGGGAIAVFDKNLSLFANLCLNFWVFLSKTFKWACGAYVFCLREAFFETGGFDERYYASEEIHFSRALHKWGRKRMGKFVILDEPIITSARKLEWYSAWEIIRYFVSIPLGQNPLKSRESCSIWYHRPDDK